MGTSATTIPTRQRLALPRVFGGCPGCAMPFPSKATLVNIGDTLTTDCCGTFMVEQNGAGEAFLRHVSGTAMNQLKVQALEHLRLRYEGGDLVLPKNPITVSVFGEPFTLQVLTRRQHKLFREDHVGRVDLNAFDYNANRPEAEPGPWLIVRDGHHEDVLPDPPRLARRVCRWCAGDGMDAMLPNRLRIFFSRPTSVPSNLAAPSSGYLGAGMAGDIAVIPKVSAWLPLDEWLERMAAAGLDIWPALHGKTKSAVACPRCGGNGNANQEVAHGAPTQD